MGVPASSITQVRGPWPENVEDPCSKCLEQGSSTGGLGLKQCLLFAIMLFYFERIGIGTGLVLSILLQSGEGGTWLQKSLGETPDKKRLQTTALIDPQVWL